MRSGVEYYLPRVNKHDIQLYSMKYMFYYIEQKFIYLLIKICETCHSQGRI